MVGVLCMLQMPFFLILNYKYCHEVTSDIFPHSPTNKCHNGVIHGNFSMNIAANPVENRLSCLIK